MNRKIAALTLALVIALLSSGVTVFEYSITSIKAAPSPFYVGVEFGYGNATDCNALVDKVKNYTNLLVISSTNITQNQVLLNQTCDYAVKAGLHVIVYFPASDSIFDNSGTGGGSYHAYLWSMKAKDKYGEYFLGAYIYDETGGEVLDKAPSAVNINYLSYSNSGPSGMQTSDYLQASNVFVTNAHNQMNDYLYCAEKSGTAVMTADYGLYWFDYKAGYDAVLAEFGWGNNRQMAIALCRGAATAQNKDWGAIICWENRSANGEPGRIESGSALKADLTLAYDNGAKYAVIFDYAGKDNQANKDLPNPYQYGILNEDHFNALKDFWNYIQQNPEKHGSTKADTALVLPQGYGFGFRNAQDKIWGMDQTDNWTTQMWNDTNNLLKEYGNKIDIVYSDPEFQASILGNYAKVVPWTSGANNENYPVIDLNNSFGYSTIQKAISSWSTLGGDTIYVKPGTYNENLIINKAVSLTGEDKETTIIDGGNKGSVLAIGSGISKVNISGFTIRNGNNRLTEQLLGSNSTASLIAVLQLYGYDISQLSSLPPSSITSLLSQILQALKENPVAPSAGIYLLNANNCTLTGNILENNTCGILLSSSSNNTLKNNVLNDNTYGFGVLAAVSSQYVNQIDNSNTINGQPIYYWVGKSNFEVPSDAGYVALVNCTDITVSNLHLSNNYNGLLLVNTENSTITNNVLSNNFEGLRIHNSENNIFQNNNIVDNQFNFYADLSKPNSIDSSNTLNGKPIFIWTDQHDKTIPVDAGYVALINCSKITVQNLNFTKNEVGVLLQNSQNSTLTRNAFSNMNCAIELTSASNNLITQNTLTNCQNGIKIEASSNNNVIDNFVSSNQLSGVNIQSSFNNNLQNNQLSENGQGIAINDSSHNTIKGNNFAANSNGIQFSTSQSYGNSQIQSTCTDNKITENNFVENQNGVSTAVFVAGNSFYHNNFVNNTQQANTQSASSTIVANIWDNGKEGNYWSNYNGTDINHDGIGDQPYIISQQYQYYYGGPQGAPTPTYSDVDKFPLMARFPSP